LINDGTMGQTSSDVQIEHIIDGEGIQMDEPIWQMDERRF